MKVYYNWLFDILVVVETWKGMYRAESDFGWNIYMPDEFKHSVLIGDL